MNGPTYRWSKLCETWVSLGAIVKPIQIDEPRAPGCLCPPRPAPQHYDPRCPLSAKEAK